jgi:hypothetical protein
MAVSARTVGGYYWCTRTQKKDILRKPLVGVYASLDGARESQDELGIVQKV